MPTPPTDPLADVAFTQITTGKAHACGLRENGAIVCWSDSPPTAKPPPQGAFIEIAAGAHFTCALRQDAIIACWGRNSRGQATPPQGAFSEIDARADNACAIPISQSSPFKLLCWGGLFPNGAESLSMDAPISDIQIGGGPGVSICGLTSQGDIACLSIGNRATEITPGPFTQLAVGFLHLCALREDGSAFCKGNNPHRQASPPPTKFAQIAAGLYHSCGITRAANLECWGSGRAGAPGERLTAPDGEFAAITIGIRNSCALRPNGRAVCWETPDYLPNPNYLPDGISEAFGGAKFDAPVDIFPWPKDGLAIVDLSGVITAQYDEPNAPPTQTILDISDAVNCCQGESGMLSAAPDPQFQDFPFLYVWYITAADTDNLLGGGARPDYGRRQIGRLARFRIERGVALKNSELPILEVPLPNRRHLGGAVRFGADGMLYLGIGDNLTPDNAQALNDLQGKIIRIDVRGANAERPYRIPPDNPFANNPDARPEIWAYGLRNPWRMAFDPANPASLFVADVGDKTREEVSVATAGANLGWPLCEADICQESLDPALAASLDPPAISYGRDLGCAIIGGVTVPSLDNRFIFGDLCSRRVWLLERDSPSDSAPANAQDSPQDWRMREIADLSESTRNIIAFGKGADGSVYVLPRTGAILRLYPDPAE